MALGEKQFSLDGVVFGLNARVGLADGGWGTGSPALRTSDEALPGHDGVRFGQDFKGATTWSFSLYTDEDDEESAWAAVAELKAAWDADHVRREAEEVVALSYCLAGRQRRVYGRPRRWTEIVDNLSMSGRIGIECDFEISSHLFFNDEVQTKNISILPALELDAGVVPPFIVPFISDAGETERESAITIGGDAETPLVIKFEAGTGDLYQASVQVGGKTVALVDAVDQNDPVVADARPWARSVTTQSGGGVRVSPSVTRISQLWLPPGTHEVIFRGTDPTGSASAVISWHDAHRTIR